MPDRGDIVPHPDPGVETEVADHTNTRPGLQRGSRQVDDLPKRSAWLRMGAAVQNIDHADLRAKLGAYSADALGDVEWLMVRTHLWECAPCQAELGRPELWNRAAPQRISPSKPSRDRRPQAQPGWSVAFGLALVAALVAFGVGYALGTTG
ncbi:hypothetical protein [Saccharopolyspora pogona]|uniref:hypothetical protein n=1 Tax=Saccharopolyspora pogona TaxID=333966 RepID=UPI00168752A0|nr:hypothetical protein [Saccharopolyspora pogona]